MATYGQYCPMARGAEVFATRWTPLIVRNLVLGCRTFGEIRAGLPGISKTLLSQRLDMLERYGVIERCPNPNGRGSLYELTECGRELNTVCQALGVWGARWIELAPEHFDAGTVLWGLCKVVPVEQLPAARTVVRIDVVDRKRDRFWLLLDRPNAEVCAVPPGPTDDAVVTTSPEWLTRFYVGEVSLAVAMRDGLIDVEAPRALVRTIASWGGLGAGPERLAGPAARSTTASPVAASR